MIICIPGKKFVIRSNPKMDSKMIRFYIRMYIKKFEGMWLIY